MLTPGEITTGMKITVVNWKPREILNILFNNNDSFIQPTNTIVKDRSWCGDVLEVLAVDLPYIVVKKLNTRDDCEKNPFHINTTECNLKELKSDYVKSLLPHLSQNPTGIDVSGVTKT